MTLFLKNLLLQRNRTDPKGFGDNNCERKKSIEGVSIFFVFGEGEGVELYFKSLSTFLAGKRSMTENQNLLAKKKVSRSMGEGRRQGA